MKYKLLKSFIGILLSYSIINIEAKAYEEKIVSSVEYQDESMNYYKKGRDSYLKLGEKDLRESLELYDKGLEINKNNPLLYAGKVETLYLLYFYQILRYESNIEQAKLKNEIIKNATFAYDINPNLVETHRAMSISYTTQELSSLAQEEAKKSLEIDKTNGESYLWLWAVEEKLDPKDKNIITASNILPNSSLVNLFWAIGYDFNGKGEWIKEPQIKLLNTIIDNNPDNDIAYTILGKWYYKYKKDKDKAIQSFEKAIEINDKNPQAYYNLGIIYSKKKMNYKAVNYYKRACELKIKDACNELRNLNY
ncbi:MAG: tetratricopeptide repeat protein [Candidatus Sericytochromatia bacterium]